MKSTRTVMLPVLVVALICAGALVLSWADGADGDVGLSGITVEDAHPNACVDCHSDAGDTDYRLNVSLKEIEGHPDITNIVRNLPNDCAMCHKENAPAGALNIIVHKAHYSNPDENHFVTGYAGECLACHALNTETGEMSNKSGPKNW